MLGQIHPATLSLGAPRSCAWSLSHTFCVHTHLYSQEPPVYLCCLRFSQRKAFLTFLWEAWGVLLFAEDLKLSRAVRALPFFVLRFQSGLAEVWRQSYQRNTCTTCKPRFLPLPKECTAGKTRTKLKEMGQRSELDLLQWSEQVGWGCAALCTYKVLLSRSSNWALRQTNTVISSSSF